MRRILIAAALLLLLVCAALAEESPAADGMVGKVITKKGSLNLRAKPDEKARIVTEIPNGTCLFVTKADDDWCQVEWKGRSGYCKSSFLILLREADPALLDYRVLSKGDRGDDVLALKTRLLELGYIRGNSTLTNVYNDTLAGRVKLFQRETGMTEDGIASQELQAYLFSARAPVCTQELPKPIRSRVATDAERTQNRVICGCCMGEGCECCDYVGWIYF